MEAVEQEQQQVTLESLNTRLLHLEEEVITLKADSVNSSLKLQKLEEIQTDIRDMKEVILAWNNAKGFVRTLSILNDIMNWAWKPALVVTAIWYFITHGVWPDWSNHK